MTMTTNRFESAVAAAVSAFGREVGPRLRAGHGEPEDQLRGPVENLFRSLAEAMGLKVVLYGEATVSGLRVRPDYVVEVAEALVGHVEIKRPGRGADPWAWSARGHDGRQWEKLRHLPNVLYTDGQEWAVYRNGERVGPIARLAPDLENAGSRLAPVDGSFARVVTEFLRWKPERPRSIGQLVRAVAGLCRLLREEVLEALRLERSGERAELFTELAATWRRLLFPDVSDEVFADQYAQTVTFALLLARVEGISFEHQEIAQIARKLGKTHSLMGKALDVLTDDSLGGVGVTLQTLVRVVGAVDWDLLDDGSGDAYLHLYEHFLEVYDPELRKQSGSYYTPNDVVRFIVRFVDEILRHRLGLRKGFAEPGVVVVDPAMGTGTFLLNVVERVAATAAREQGPGAVGEWLRDLAERLVGFERQTGPYAVAELRLHETLHRYGSAPPGGRLQIFVADTLADPRVEEAWLPLEYAPIATSLRKANQVKRDEQVRVVIGNPPYGDRAKGLGGWIETGPEDPERNPAPPLDAFRAAGKGRYEYVLSNLYVYFWRWATWKVFDAHPDEPTGVVAFITTSGYLGGPGFAGMREYLRRTADEGWIVDLSPEGHQPDVATRVFRAVQQPICIGVFARYGPPAPDRPAVVHHLAVSGSRAEKFARLAKVGLDDPAWADCPTGWQDRFLPAAAGGWPDYPALGDLMPWAAPGVKPNRTWVYAPDPETLRQRWARLVTAPREQRRVLLKETQGRTIDSRVEQVTGLCDRVEPVAETAGPGAEPVPVGYRSFDRQWLLPDNRLIDRIRPELWRVRGDRQVFVTEQHAEPLDAGPGLTFSAFVPDMHHYNGRGGRVLPLFRDPDSRVPNLAPGLMELLAARLGVAVDAEDVLAYVAALVAHPGYTERFYAELRTPGVRVPLTADPALWAEAVALGREAVWLHTYGERYADPAAGRPAGPPRLAEGERPQVLTPIAKNEQDMPDTIGYDAASRTLLVGTGRITPVPPEVWAYEVSGMKVVRKWFGYRKKNPSGRRSSPLDDVNPTTWRRRYTDELIDLLNVLGRLVKLEPHQADLLARVCAGPLVTVPELEEAGVLPVPAKARRPVLQRGEGGQLSLPE
ncbi:N-6 DNA methylase [Carbonactinospora thermoautotrophica]|uniref:site-specific DNA-methyltransferase (adenine-specific) n=2 Tax=Carbonactinospora thermoautotrophica TaxID=1469144 RepID=A0A132MMN7_9ACTN|nr:N-6 DNA methylase [Carbonactinospora thermoautotrophica]